MDRLQRSTINMLTSAAGYMLPMLVSLITTPLLLRMLGEAAYGLQSLVAVIIGYLTFMDFGLDLPITKLLAEDRARGDLNAENKLLSTTIQLYAGIGLVGMIAIMLSADWLATSVFRVPADWGPSASLVFRLAGVGFLGSVGLSWGRAVTTGLQRFDLMHTVSLTVSIGGTLGGLVAVYAGFGLVGYVFVRVVFSVLSGPAFFILARRLLDHFHLELGIDWATLKRVRSYVGYGVINRVVSSVIGRIDQTLIGIWVGVAAVGIYAIPFMLTNLPGYMLSYMLGFIFPMASEFQSLDQMDRLRDVFIRTSRFMGALASMIYVLLFVLGDLFLNVWVGPSVAQQTNGVFRLLTLAGYVASLAATLPNNVAVGLGRMRHFTIYANLKTLVFATGCLIFISQFGLIGAGIALLVAVVVDCGWFSFVLLSFLHISPLKLIATAYLKPIALGIGLGGLAFLLRPFGTSWLGLGLVGVGLELAYVIVGYAIGIFGETEKRAMMGLWQMAVRQVREVKEEA